MIDTGVSDSAIWIIMEDLDAAGFNKRFQAANVSIAAQCILWLSL